VSASLEIWADHDPTDTERSTLKILIEEATGVVRLRRFELTTSYSPDSSARRLTDELANEEPLSNTRETEDDNDDNDDDVASVAGAFQEHSKESLVARKPSRQLLAAGSAVARTASPSPQPTAPSPHPTAPPTTPDPTPQPTPQPTALRRNVCSFADGALSALTTASSALNPSDYCGAASALGSCRETREGCTHGNGGASLSFDGDLATGWNGCCDG
jgi:hypothetical protein